MSWNPSKIETTPLYAPIASQPEASAPSESRLNQRIRVRRMRSASSQDLPKISAKQMVLGLSVAYFMLMLLVSWIVFDLSEDWWLSFTLVYLPRLPWTFPAFVLLAAAAVWHRPSVWINLLSLTVVIGLLMELHVPVSRWMGSHSPSEPGAKKSLRVLSCNVQNFQPNFQAVLEEIRSVDPDVVAFQEAGERNPVLDQVFEKWYRVHSDLYWIGSRYPLRLVKTINSPHFQRLAGIVVEIDAPQGKMMVFNIHQMTARRGLELLSPGGILSGRSQSQLDDFQTARVLECKLIHDVVDELGSGKPVLVMGDFNMPSSSTMYHRFWSDLQNAYDETGTGYGYTAPCKRHRWWFDRAPWSRIDHILTNEHWNIHDCVVGTNLGSDHKLIWSEMELVPPSLTAKSRAESPSGDSLTSSERQRD